VVDLRAALLDPSDLRGIPAIVDGRAVWCPPAFLPTSDQTPGVLFLDEVNAAPPMVQAGLYQLLLDRRLGEYELPVGWWVVAAGNRHQDRAVTFRMSSALANRFVHLQLDPDLGDWREWAIVRNINPLVMSFLATRPELLAGAPGDSPSYPTPRSWEMLSDVIEVFGGHRNCTDLVPGVVGEGAAIEFAAHANKALQEADLRAILADPGAAPLPTSLDGLYMLTSWLVHSVAQPGVVPAAAILLGRVPPEFGVVLARDMLKAAPVFVREPGYKAFLQAHGNLIAR
jgi:hypothetical protein